MKKLILLNFLLLSSISAQASIQIPEPPAKSYKDMGLWRDKVVFNFSGQDIHLTEPTYLSADEVIISTKIYTHGFEFKIDTKKLTFEKNGEILSYAEPANGGVKGKKGLPAKRAHNGGDGYVGGQGSNGEQLPGAIIFFAAETLGVIKVNGTGQVGGTGGIGGDGAQGGKGIDGKDADVNCWGEDKHGTDGGRGALGGWGGQGGNGGRGGRKIPMIFFTNNNKRLSLNEIVSNTGAPGLAGHPGKAGPPGVGGEGGLPDSNKCDALHGRDTARPGTRGPEGHMHSKNHGVGQPGESADDQLYLPEALQMFLNDKVIQLSENLKEDYVKPKQHVVGDEHKFRKKILVNKSNKERFKISYGSDNVVEYFEEESIPGVLLGDLHGMELKRKALVEPWLNFHITRLYYLLIFSTMNSISNNLQFDHPKDSFQWKAQVNKIKNLKKIWQVNFLQKLNAQDNNSMGVVIANAKKLVGLLSYLEDGVKSNSDIDVLSSYLDESKSIVQSKLNAAINSCEKFTSEKKNFLSYIFKFTSHFNVPVCNGVPDFSMSENIMGEIRIFKNHKLAYKPEFLSKYKVENNTAYFDVKKYLREISNLFISDAYAEYSKSEIPVPNDEDLVMVGLGIDSDKYSQIFNIEKKLLNLVQFINQRGLQ